MPVLAELTPQELDNLRAIVKEKIKPLNIDIGTLKTDIVQLDGRLTDVEKQSLYATNVTYGSNIPYYSRYRYPRLDAKRDRDTLKMKGLTWHTIASQRL